MWTSAIRRALARAAVPAAAAGVLCAPVSGLAAEGSPGDEAAQAAVWTHKELTFVYQGFTTKYSCDGLRDKMMSALLQLGAKKKDLHVSEYGCVRGYGRPDEFPGVRIKMSVLQPAGPNDKQTPVQAHWKTVDLRLKDYNYPTESGECELVEQIKDKILPLFATRNLNYRSECIPFQATPAGPSLKVEVLQADRKEGKGGAAG